MSIFHVEYYSKNGLVIKPQKFWIPGTEDMIHERIFIKSLYLPVAGISRKAVYAASFRF